MSVEHRPSRLCILVLALLIVAAGASAEPQTDLALDDEMGTLVTTEWLSRHLDDPDLVLLDCTVSMVPDEAGGMVSVSGRGAYEAGHIPSAGFADLEGDVSDTSSPFAYALPTPERFCDVMGALGVGDDSRVVLYDGLNSVWAARVWWMLRWVGFDNAALLDGGLAVWTAEERPLSTEPADERPGVLTPSVRPELVADRDEVLAAIEDDAVTLIDAMPEPHFKGQMVMYARPGHIPSAVNIPVFALLDETGRFRSDDEIAALFDFERDARVITYCGGGIAASGTAFAMTRLGFTNVAVYTASLQEWAADPDLPLVVEEPEAPSAPASETD